MTNREERPQPIPPPSGAPAAGYGAGVAVIEAANAGPDTHSEDPDARQESGREPLENVEATLDKIDENPEIEGT